MKDGKVSYIRPLKRNNKPAKGLGLYDGYCVLGNSDEKILYSKSKEEDANKVMRYYYSF